MSSLLAVLPGLPAALRHVMLCCRASDRCRRAQQTRRSRWGCVTLACSLPHPARAHRVGWLGEAVQHHYRCCHTQRMPCWAAHAQHALCSSPKTDSICFLRANSPHPPHPCQSRCTGAKQRRSSTQLNPRCVHGNSQAVPATRWQAELQSQPHGCCPPGPKI